MASSNLQKSASSPLPVRNFIAIGSGKGGVGKSTTTVNLAYALRERGYTVGILDADLYGPSIPLMLQLNEKPTVNDTHAMIPLEKDGIQIMSMGFLIEQESPLIWRGPMLQKAIHLFTSQVAWNTLDFLLIDLPPGTGDIQLSLSTKLPLTGAIIVSTPQDVALSEARKAIEMFKKVGVPTLGLIENMASFHCPHCQTSTPLFDEGGVEKISQKLGIPLLAQIPLDLRVRTLTDSGQQVTLIQGGALGQLYLKAADFLQNLCAF